ncbi:hypothetical protein Tco_0721540 [Tanacetum coccineum]
MLTTPKHHLSCTMYGGVLDVSTLFLSSNSHHPTVRSLVSLRLKQHHNYTPARNQEALSQVGADIDVLIAASRSCLKVAHVPGPRLSRNGLLMNRFWNTGAIFNDCKYIDPYTGIQRINVTDQLEVGTTLFQASQLANGLRQSIRCKT